MSAHVARFLAEVGVWGGTIIPVLFVIHYTFRLKVRWWEQVTGRALITLDAALWLVCAGVAVSLDPHLPHHAGLTTFALVAGLLLAPLSVLYRIVAFEREYRRRRRQAQRQAFQKLTALSMDWPSQED